jgi:hypothetical protein
VVRDRQREAEDTEDAHDLADASRRDEAKDRDLSPQAGERDQAPGKPEEAEHGKGEFTNV